MSVNEVLYIGFIIYLIMLVMSYLLKNKYIFLLSGLIWFIPIFEVDNTFIKLVSVIMLIMHFMIGMVEDNGGDF